MNRETVSQVCRLFGANVLYLEYEPETEKYGGDIYRKWGDAVQHVGTEYSIICTDKEFVVPSTLQGLIHYLDNNLDYAMASGNYYYCHNTNDPSGTVKIWSNRKSIDQDDGLKRYSAAVNGMTKQSSLFSLYRSHIHKIVYKAILDRSIQDIRYGERYLMFCGYIFGKMYEDKKHTLNVRDVSHVVSKKRRNKEESSASRYSLSYSLLLKSITTIEPFATSYVGFKNSTYELLLSYSDISEKKLNEHWDNYIDPVLTRSMLDYPRYLSLLVKYCSDHTMIYNIIKRIAHCNKQPNLDQETILIIKNIEMYDSYHSSDQQISL